MKTAFQLGVFAFGIVTVGQLAPSLLSDTHMSGWEFARVTLAFFATLFCAYQSFGKKAIEAETAS